MSWRGSERSLLQEHLTPAEALQLKPAESHSEAVLFMLGMQGAPQRLAHRCNFVADDENGFKGS